VGCTLKLEDKSISQSNWPFFGSKYRTEYTYDLRSRINATYDGSGNLLEHFIYGTKSNVPDAMIRSDGTYRIVSDQIGTVRLVVNSSSGQVAQEIDYDEFGQVLNDTNPGFQPFGFAGGLYESQTKLVRFGARDYDPETGRFVSKDPLLFGGGQTNLYGYVLNDPINYIDPNGEKLTFGNATAIGVGTVGVVAGIAAGLSGNPFLGAALLTGGAALTISGLIDAGIDFSTFVPPNSNSLNSPNSPVVNACR
jgi:RHS repeat-associated protein